VPRRLGGKRKIRLLIQHAAVLSVLTSEHYGCNCTEQKYEFYLQGGKYFDLYEKWINSPRGQELIIEQIRTTKDGKPYNNQTSAKAVKVVATHIKTREERIFASLAEIERTLRMSKHTVIKVMNGERPENHGWTFRKLEPEGEKSLQGG
jgi:hypothetical protein